MKHDFEILLALLNEVNTNGKRSLNNLLLAIQIIERLQATLPAEEGKDGSN